MRRLKFLHHNNILKGMINIMTVMLGIFGLSSHYYSAQRDRYYTSKFMLLYATIVSLTFSSVYLHDIYNDYVLDHFDLTNVTKLYSYLNIMASIVSYVTGLSYHKHMPVFMNKVQIVERVKFLGMSKEMVIRPVLSVFLRAILIPVAIEATLLWDHWHNQSDRSILWTGYVLFPMIISQIMPNCVFGVFELCHVYIVALNSHLRNIEIEVLQLQMAYHLQTQKPYQLMKRYCELADRVDALAEKYTPICYQALEYVDLYAFPFVVALLCNVFAIVVGCYLQYKAIVDSYIDDKPFDVNHCIINIIFLFISLSEIIFLANTTNDNISTIRETSEILQNIKLTHADVRFKVAVEVFSLIAYTNQYKIKPLGLLEINMSLISNVPGTITSILLILIQSDLALRFSMK